MQVVGDGGQEEPRAPAQLPSRTLLWACAGLIETLCLMVGLYWILNTNDPRPLALRVTLVAVVSAVCGVGTLLALLRFVRDR